MDSDALLAGLDDAQRQAVTTPVSPLRILAGAGSGKTRVLTRRIAYRSATGEIDPRRVLAITFTRKAAGELVGRLRALGLRDAVTAGTFHAVALAQLRARCEDRGARLPAVLDNRRQFVARLCGRAAHAEVAAEIDWAKSRRVLPADYERAARQAGRRPGLGAAAVAELYERYERDKRAARLVDFDDLLWLCAQEVERDEAHAAAVRWRHRHLFVDEFQDVNPLQLRLLEAWRGPSSDLCVVGDPNQSIYSWNGSDPRYLLEFEAHHPGCETVALGVNYRSSPEVLAVAAAVLHGSAAAPAIAALREDGTIPTVTAYADDVTEAAAVARAVRDRHAPATAWSHQAVLVRTNAQAALLHRALVSALVPCQVRAAGPSVEPVEDDRRTDLDDVDRDALAPELARPAVDGDAVVVATFHAAKGLEWPIVHIAGLEQGLVPIGRARTAAAEAEERRLLYVALTRAEHELHCSWAMARTVGGDRLARQPSPYLSDIEGAIAKLLAAAAPGDWRNHLAAERTRLAGAGSRGDAPLIDALRSWRATAARAATVTPAAIMSDRTVEAVAAARPSSEEDLLALPDLGPVKVERFGSAILAIVDLLG